MLRLLLIGLAFLTLGCIDYYKYKRAEAEADIRQSQAALLKDYRDCIKTKEAKECEKYIKAVQDVNVDLK